MKENKEQYFPFEKYMEIGMGILKTSPDDFWNMTLYEFMCVYRGYLKGIGHNISPAITKEEIKKLQEFIDLNVL